MKSMLILMFNINPLPNLKKKKYFNFNREFFLRMEIQIYIL